MEKIRICPRCQKPFNCYPAISREDNETEICPECGLVEALDAFGFSPEDKDEILKKMREASNSEFES